MISGILPLYKPRGMTSHDCVFRLRKLFKIKKIGHTGTLDPDVDGVLPICIGRATKIAEYLTADTKAYTGVIVLGSATETEDASGAVIAEKKVCRQWSRQEIDRVFQSFLGPIRQRPPMYSAVKVNGKKLYDYAREGKEVERPLRTVEIFSLRINGDQDVYTNRIPFRVDCSKGTYVRTLAVDIGAALGYPAHLDQLTRIRSGSFVIDDCFTFDEVETALDRGAINALLIDIGAALKDMPSWVVDENMESKILNGAVLPVSPDFPSNHAAVYNKQGGLLAIYEQHPRKPGLVKPVKVLEIN